MKKHLLFLLSFTFLFGSLFGQNSGGTRTGSGYTDAQAIAANAPAIAAINFFQPETRAYRDRILAAGGSINVSDLQALDTFVIIGKSAGWWQAVKFFAPMMGNNLNSALVKFVVDASGVPTLTNTNFVEADYNSQFGFVLSANTNKRLNTSFVPVDNGISPNAIGALICTPKRDANTGYLVSDNNSTAAGLFPMLTFFGNGVTAASWQVASSSAGTPIINCSTGALKTEVLMSINGAVGNFYTNSVSASSATNLTTSTVTLNTEMMFFARRFTGNYNYSVGSLGGVLFTTALTPVQNESLARAYYQLNRTIRRSLYETPTIAWFGDSITSWVGSIGQGYSAFASSLLGVTELNFGTPSSKVVGLNTFNNATPYLTRYQEIIKNNYGFNTIGIMGGTNDLLVDPAANGTAATITAYQAGLITIYNGFIAATPKVLAIGLCYNTNVSLTKLNAYYAANIAAAQSAGLIYIDCYNIYLDATESASALMPDGTHPSLIYAQLIGEHVAAAYHGRIYRDFKIPATVVPANGSVNIDGTFYGLKIQHTIAYGQPTVANSGITITARYKANDVITYTLTNTTGADVTTAVTNLRTVVFTY